MHTMRRSPMSRRLSVMRWPSSSICFSEIRACSPASASCPSSCPRPCTTITRARVSAEAVFVTSAACRAVRSSCQPSSRSADLRRSSRKWSMTSRSAAAPSSRMTTASWTSAMRLSKNVSSSASWRLRMPKRKQAGKACTSPTVPQMVWASWSVPIRPRRSGLTASWPPLPSPASP